MKFINYIKSMFSTDKVEIKNVVQSYISAPSYTPNNLESFIQDGYVKNEILYSAINLRANSFIEADLVVVNKDGSESDEDLILNPFFNPNEYTSYRELFKLIIMHLDLDGNAFLVKEKTKGGKVIGLHPLRPDRVGVQTSQKPGRLISHYIYNIGGKDQIYKTEDIVHIKTPNPLTPWRGISPIQPIIRSINTDSDAIDMIKSILENGGMPGGIITVKDTINKANIDRLRDQWRQEVGGKNKGKVAIMPGDMEYQPMSASLGEMDVTSITNLTETRILAALGINPIILGVMSGQNASTFNNVAEAKLSFYQQTILPLHTMVCDAFTNDPDLNPNKQIKFYFNSDNVSALIPLKQQKQEMVSEGFRDGWLTANEIRAERGYSPVEGGDVLYIGTADTGGDYEDSYSDDEEKSVESLKEDLEKKQALIKKSELEQVIVHVEKVRKIADDGYNDLLEWSESFYSKVYKEVEKLAFSSVKSYTQDQYDNFEKGLIILENDWKNHIATDRALPILPIMKETANAQLGNLNISFKINNNQVRDFINEYQFKFADRVSRTAASRVRSIFLEAIDNGMSLDEISQVLHAEFKGTISTNKAKLIARTETIRAANEGTLAAYKSAGVKTLRWEAAGDACPYCIALDGKVVSIGEPFVEGNEFQPEGAKSALNTDYTGGIVETPPAHVNCRCAITAKDY